MNMQGILEQLPSAIGAEIQAKGNIAGQYNRAVVKFRNWPITIEFGSGRGRSVGSFTRIRAPFISKDDLEFRVENKNVLNGIGKHLLIGNPEFDKKFVVSGNDQSKIIKLLLESKMLQSDTEILKSASLKLVIGFDPEFAQGINATNVPPKGTHSLMFYKTYPVFWDESMGLFENVVEVFREILLKLVEVGSASEEDPKFEFSDLYGK